MYEGDPVEGGDPKYKHQLYNNADVVLDSGMKLSDIVNLYSKFSYEVLLKSRHCIVYLLKSTLHFGLE